MVYAEYVNTLEVKLTTIKENADVLVLASKEIRLKANGDKTTYMVMSRDQNAGRGHRMKIDNSSFGRVCHSKHF